MSSNKPRRLITFAVYFILIAGIVWQATVLADLLRPGGKFLKVRTHKVSVSGNVRKPGVYRIPEGTTQFEILKVAGVRPTSDLSSFDLLSAADKNNELNVGTRDKPVQINQQTIPARLEFFLGNVTLTSKEGQSLPTQQGIGVGEGDRIQTESSAQAEISIGPYSRVDIDNFTDLSLDRLSAREGERAMADLFQKTGSCWYKISYSENGEQYRVLTPWVAMTVGGSGADFLVEILSDRIMINIMDGLVLVEKIGGNESMNLISGQSVSIYNDSRPFQVSKLAPGVSPAEKFSALAQEKKEALTRDLPFNFLFCGTPSVFFVVSMKIDKKTLTIIQFPPELSVDQFADGISTISEAYLYGGPTFVNSLMERICNIRLSKYTVFTKDNLMKTVDIVGGMSSSLNKGIKGSSAIPGGGSNSKISSQELSDFLSPTAGSSEERKARQKMVLDALFDGIRDKTISFTPTSAQQVLALIQSNLTASELTDNFQRYASGGNWTRKSIDLPVKKTGTGLKTIYEPDLDKCRALLESN